MTAPSLSVVPTRPVFLSAREGHVDVLVRMSAPEIPASQPRTRPRLNLSLVLDRSGSMRGRPLDDAKRSAAAIVESLHEDDHVAIVVYDDSVDVVAKSTKAGTLRKNVRNMLALVNDRGGTNLHAGWLEGANQLAPNAKDGAVSRVLLLSDGQANVGVVDSHRIGAEAAKLFEQGGVSTSTYGLGPSFNEVLMSTMAVGGQAFYAGDSDQLMGYFMTEFDLLGSLAARGLRLRVTAADGKGEERKVEILNAYRRTAEGMWCLPDLVGGAEVWAVARIAVPSTDAGDLLTVGAMVDWTLPDGTVQEAMAAHSVVTAAGAEDYEKAPQDTVAVERVREVEAARINAAAAEAARRGDMDAVRVQAATLRGMAADNAFVGSTADALEMMVATGQSAASIAKQAFYASSAMSTRYAASAGEDHTVMGADRFNMRKSLMAKSSR